MILADAYPSWQSTLIVLMFLAVVGGGFATIGLWMQGRKKQSREITNDPLRVEKTAKRYNHDAQELRFGILESKTDEHGEEIGKIWNTLRVDLPAMERRLDQKNEERASELHKRNNEILIAVSELKGELKTR